MELIINLIIVLVIILSVLKRIQNVSKKETEIKGGKPVPPKPLPERMKELKRQFDIPETGQAERTIEPVPAEERTYEPVPQQFTEPVPELESEPETVLEFHQEPEILPQIEESLPVAAEQFQREKIAPPKRYRSPALNFNASAVVNGIIMSEILGRPISMRKDASPARW